MKKVTFLIGLNDKDTKIQKISTLEAYKVIENAVCEYFDKSVNEFCRVVKIALNQESISVEYHEFQGNLI